MVSSTCSFTMTGIEVTLGLLAVDSSGSSPMLMTMSDAPVWVPLYLLSVRA